MEISLARQIMQRHWVGMLLASGYFGIQFVFNGWYGFGHFNDELYYLACAARPAAGYVDHPPLSIWILRAVTSLGGDSTAAIRFLPALAGAASVFLTGLLARRMGGNTLAASLASLCVIAAPVLMVLFGFYSMNSFEVFLWVAFTLVVVIILTEDRRRLWLLAGLIAGLGLENKHTMAVYGFAFFTGLLLSPQRKHFASVWLWLGGLLAALLMLPNLLWQIEAGWPSLEFYYNADTHKNVDSPALNVILDQILAQNPVSIIIWLPGLLYLLRSKRLAQVRAFGWAYLILLATLVLAHSSRPDRIAAAYPILFAAGACALTQSGRTRLTWAAVALVTVSAAVFAPAGLPVLPPDRLAEYARTIGVIPQIERGKATALPIWFGNRFDWERMYESVKAVYESLPPSDRDNTVILAGYYSHAGAIERFSGRSIPVVSGHNNYYLWGPGRRNWSSVIAVRVPREKLEELFADVKPAGSYSRRFTNETDVPIFLCRRPRMSVDELWQRLKVYR
jgi:Dolichyl-phosphate-mannose-protein mannosyltransferase